MMYELRKTTLVAVATSAAPSLFFSFVVLVQKDGV